ncbi:uncharacterized protein Eint_110340 [Encephalitozoon intestinalis ATCC 50506]|uniref:Uncharacterized protein n=1 Tax=Encephalitozoon intestinalis (strain ATCC 50506) TaxID=876142 RepID=E0SAA9_ENCIT|nr:uncharacterized protein Eint_110340 [Encephalitozoon intestinalis ATCC 50506]ADM12534.1 hypothetical protein Eint_110340 [Encephalitozoon intestinalis ATCC 50506]UTX46387.1 hypothetical protein GPK93_11g19940 [Encephalitozoon intestinalis]
MEKIDKLFNKIRDVDECYGRYLSLRDEKVGREKELDRIEKEIKRTDSISLEKEIKKIGDEYQNILEDIEKLSLGSKECRSISDLEAIFSKIADGDVVLKKSLEFLNHSIALKYINSCGSGEVEDLESGHGDGPMVFKIGKDVETLFQLSARYMEIQEKCYFSLRSIVHKNMLNIVPIGIKVFQDDLSLFFVFKGQSGDLSHCELVGKAIMGLEEISKYEMMSHVIFGVLRDNMKNAVVEEDLSDESIEASNAFFRDTEFYIHNVVEWKLDVVMKEIIEMTKGPRDMEAVKTFELSNRMPKSISASYKRFQKCFEVFRKLKSKRHEKGVRVINRAIKKLFDPKRYEPSIYSYFIEFADITHFLRVYPGHCLADELSKRKEELFFDVIKESSRINVALDEPLVTLKLYFKEKHVEFVENMELFVPEINMSLFEIQFFEMLGENLMKKIQELKMAKRSTIENLPILIDYILDLSFHLPAGAIGSQGKLKSYKQVLSSNRAEVIEGYRNGKLFISSEEFISLCSLVFQESEDKKLLLSEIENK